MSHLGDSSIDRGMNGLVNLNGTQISNDGQNEGKQLSLQSRLRIIVLVSLLSDLDDGICRNVGKCAVEKKLRKSRPEPRRPRDMKVIRNSVALPKNIELNGANAKGQSSEVHEHDEGDTAHKQPDCRPCSSTRRSS